MCTSTKYVFYYHCLKKCDHEKNGLSQKFHRRFACNFKPSPPTSTKVSTLLHTSNKHAGYEAQSSYSL